MKKSFLLILGTALTMGVAFAQVPSSKPFNRAGSATPMNTPQKNVSGLKATDQFYLDLAEAERVSFPNIETFIQQLQDQNDTTSINGDSRGYYTAIASFDTLVLTKDFTNYTYGNYSNIQSLSVDTISFVASLKKATPSSVIDSIVIYVLPTNNAGFPLINSAPIWDTIIELTDQTPANNSTAGPGQYYGGIFNIATGGISVTGNKKFAIEFRYHGSTQDTLMIWGAYPTDESPCVINGTPQSYPDILEGNFYPAAFYTVPLGMYVPTGTTDTIWNSESVLVPRDLTGATNPGQFVWYLPCGGKPASINGVTYANNPAVNMNQYWNVWTSLTVEHNISVKDMDAKSIIVTNYPNPAVESTTIEYTVPAEGNVTLNITDLTGKQLVNQNLGKVAGGTNSYVLNTSSFNAGVYIYTLNYNGTQVTRKFVVAK